MCNQQPPEWMDEDEQETSCWLPIFFILLVLLVFYVVILLLFRNEQPKNSVTGTNTIAAQYLQWDTEMYATMTAEAR
jgi:uncharacterized protein YpmS